MMVGVTAHEAEEVPHPIGDAKTKHLLIEADSALNVGGEECDMAELERADAGNLLVLAEIAPILEQLDHGSLVILERKHLTNAGHGIVAQLAAHAVLGKPSRHLTEVGIGPDLECEPHAVR